MPYAVKNVQEVLGQKPVFGICMGHQILGQAVGGATFKLKFGHHGGNHPIRFNESGAAAIAHVLHCMCHEPHSYSVGAFGESSLQRAWQGNSFLCDRLGDAARSGGAYQL